MPKFNTIHLSSVATHAAMQPSKRSSSKEEITQEVPTKITSQHFMFPQVCFL
jgi:hypothetical protein